MPTEVGNQAPLPTTPYPDQTDSEYVLADHLEKGPMLLGIYKSSCAASKAMMPVLDRYFKKYGDHGLSVFGVAQDTPNVTRSFVRRTGVTYPILIEGDEYPISREFDIFATPTIYVIDQDGNVTYTTMGFMRPQLEELTGAIASLLDIEPDPIVAADEEDVPFFVPG